MGTNMVPKHAKNDSFADKLKQRALQNRQMNNIKVESVYLDISPNSFNSTALTPGSIGNPVTAVTPSSSTFQKIEIKSNIPNLKGSIFSERTSNVNNLSIDHKLKQPDSATQIKYQGCGTGSSIVGSRSRLQKNKYRSAHNCSGLQVLCSKPQSSEKENQNKCETPLSGYFKSNNSSHQTHAEMNENNNMGLR